MNEYYCLASCEQIFYGPFKCILASFILVNSNCDQAIATNLSSSITSLWIWKMHFVIQKAVSQIISNFGSLSFLEKSIFIFFSEVFCLLSTCFWCKDIRNHISKNRVNKWLTKNLSVSSKNIWSNWRIKYLPICFLCAFLASGFMSYWCT